MAADYYFQGLSPHDLEVLVRDLLQAEFGVFFESFSAGPDRGIDLRCAKGKAGLVVQCKHYPHTNWAVLRRELSQEAAKVHRLNPKRYVLATSMGLTPQRKDEIVQLFSPHCRATDDVFGRDDLNNLLNRHTEVERSHHKLWLTSVPVLQRVLNSSIYAEQQGELDHIQRRVSRFVTNPSIGRAVESLNKHHVAVITGVPGVGKSTLAEMLLIEHMERGFEPFRIWEGVEEARAVFQRAEKQLFYFDDFLGRTGLRHTTQKNEDERLVRFLRDVNKAPNTRMVLTTREYILNQARQFMEALGTRELDVATCVVNLGDYTPRIRAEILYNHLYFSDLPGAHLEALLRSRTYRVIVRHQNYSPRILEMMTDALNVRTLPPDSYPQSFVDALENPSRVWDVAFRMHLSPEAQHTLLVMVTLPDPVPLGEAEAAFLSLHAARSARYSTQRTAWDWDKALRELDGNFIKTELQDDQHVVDFHNPSIQDFLESHVRNNNADVEDLIVGAAFARQVAKLWEVLYSEDATKAPASIVNRLTARYWELKESLTIGVRRHSYVTGRAGWRSGRDNLLDRFLTLWDMVIGTPLTDRSVLERACRDVLQAVWQRRADRQELVAVMRRFLASDDPRFDSRHELAQAAYQAAFTFDTYIQIGEYATLGRFSDAFPNFVSEDARERMTQAFADTLASEEEAILDQSDRDTQLAMYEELRSAASTIGVPLGISEEDLDGTNREDEYDGGEWTSGDRSSNDEAMTDPVLDALFDSLRGRS